MRLGRVGFELHHPAIVLHQIGRLKAFETGRNPIRQNGFENHCPPVSDVEQLFLPGRASWRFEDDRHHLRRNHLPHFAVKLVHIVKMSKNRAEPDTRNLRNTRSARCDIALTDQIKHGCDDLRSARPAAFPPAIRQRRFCA